MKTKKMLVLLIMFMTTMFAGAAEWWRNPALKLDWKPFTALPTISTPYLWYWDIQERSDGGNPKFFAQSIVWNDPSAPAYNNKFLMANPSATPIFTEAQVNLPFINPFSSTMVKWDHSYNEFSLGTNNGLWIFDESLSQFVNIWTWGWDPTYQIVSLGDHLYGRVTSWGSYSGYHTWKPDGTHTYVPSGGTTQIWGDPISGRHGTETYFARKVSANQSIVIDRQLYYLESLYSLDGGVNFLGRLGLKNDGTPLYLVTNFYAYADGVIIILTRNATWGETELYIGSLGGTFYPLPLPQFENVSVTTFFYSPSTRLLVAGNVSVASLYSVVLPMPEADMKVQNLRAQNNTIVSWNIQNSGVILQKSADLVTWETVTDEKVNIGARTQAVVPGSSLKMFFRLTYP